MSNNRDHSDCKSSRRVFSPRGIDFGFSARSGRKRARLSARAPCVCIYRSAKYNVGHTLAGCFPGCSAVGRSRSASAATGRAWRSRTWSWPRRVADVLACWVAVDSAYSRRINLLSRDVRRSATACCDARPLVGIPVHATIGSGCARTASYVIGPAWRMSGRRFIS